MSSGPVELRGAQQPRSLWVPPYVSSAGEEAVELAAVAGLELDPWQALVLTHMLGERKDGTWAAKEVGLEVSRQNGKGSIEEARQLAGLFLLGERLQIHSAHRFKTAKEAFRRLLRLIEETPDLEREVKRISNAHGEEGIELFGNRRIGFQTRATAGGRGLGGSPIYLDEAMEIKEDTHGDLMPVLSAQPNPQLIYAGSAVNQEAHEHGVVFARIRQRGLRGGDPRLAWFGWGDPTDLLPEEAGEILDDPKAWAAANPALGIRISTEWIETERQSMSARNFAVERLGIGDWPDPDATTEEDDLTEFRRAWELRADRPDPTQGHLGSQPLDPVVVALDVSPNRSSSSVSIAGLREDGRRHVELVKRAKGTRWVAGDVATMVRKQGIRLVLLDEKGPAASLLDELEDALDGLDVETRLLKTDEYAEACAGFLDDVLEDGLRHLDQPTLNAAIEGAVLRPLGERSAWSRRKSNVDITPLVSCSIARYGAVEGEEESVYNDRELMVLD